MNPTTDVVEQRIAALEGGVAALLLASGQAAGPSRSSTWPVRATIVSSPRLYGGTYNLFHHTLPKLGIETTFVGDPDDLDSWQAAVRPEQGVLRRDDLQPEDRHSRHPGWPTSPTERGAADRRQHHRHPVPDQPIAHGADIVVHSATKYLGGHGTAIAGVIVDGGTFDWTGGAAGPATSGGAGKFPGSPIPDPSYHGVVFADLGERPHSR